LCQNRINRCPNKPFPIEAGNNRRESHHLPHPPVPPVRVQHSPLAAERASDAHSAPMPHHRQRPGLRAITRIPGGSLIKPAASRGGRNANGPSLAGSLASRSLPTGGNQSNQHQPPTKRGETSAKVQWVARPRLTSCRQYDGGASNEASHRMSE
jgi:hypothetical protein